MNQLSDQDKILVNSWNDDLRGTNENVPNATKEAILVFLEKILHHSAVSASDLGRIGT